MTLPSAFDGMPRSRCRIRSCPEDFVVCEELGFDPDGTGEHAFLQLEKRGLNTVDLAQRLSEVSGVPLRDIGYSGLKDRNAVTRQWISVGLAGRDEPDWEIVARRGDVKILQCTRHGRKLRRGVHRANAFTLILRDVEGDRDDLVWRLQQVRDTGVPNFFGEQRFGRDGNTLNQARRWVSQQGGRRLSRHKRGLYLSALRAYLFNLLLAERVRGGNWNRVLEGDVCALQGTRSFFPCAEVDAGISRRAASGDLHPALPLWGRGRPLQGTDRLAEQQALLASEAALCAGLEAAGLELDYRPARLLADDFCWQFCDDDSLRLTFRLGSGSYATAVLAQIINYSEGDSTGGDGGD